LLVFHLSARASESIVWPKIKLERITSVQLINENRFVMIAPSSLKSISAVGSVDNEHPVVINEMITMYCLIFIIHPTWGSPGAKPAAEFIMVHSAASGFAYAVKPLVGLFSF
jgi:hypothetical protein